MFQKVRPFSYLQIKFHILKKTLALWNICHKSWWTFHQEKRDSPLRILLFGGADIKHLLRTVAGNLNLNYEFHLLDSNPHIQVLKCVLSINLSLSASFSLRVCMCTWFFLCVWDSVCMCVCMFVWFFHESKNNFNPIKLFQARNFLLLHILFSENNCGPDNQVISH